MAATSHSEVPPLVLLEIGVTVKDEDRKATPLPSLNEELSQEPFELPLPLGPMAGQLFLHEHNFEDTPLAVMGAVQMRDLDEVTVENQHDIHYAKHYVDQECPGCGEKHALITVNYFSRTHELAKLFEQRLAEVAMEIGLLDQRHRGIKPN